MSESRHVFDQSLAENSRFSLSLAGYYLKCLLLWSIFYICLTKKYVYFTNIQSIGIQEVTPEERKRQRKRSICQNLRSSKMR
jgi:hypothetical protein